MIARTFIVLTGLALGLFLGVGAQAQESRGYVNAYAGVLIMDDGKLDEVTIDPAALFGVGIGFPVGANWEIGGAYGYAPATAKFDVPGSPEVDAKIHAYYATLNYLIPSQSRARVFVSGGVGGFTVNPDKTTFGGETFDPESSNDLLVNVGAGLRYRASDRFALQGVVRDHIQFCKTEPETSNKVSLCDGEDSALNHIEISGGILFLM